MNSQVLLETRLAGLPVRRGKIRDVYDLGDRLLIVATDRISAFDVVMGSGIPDKGRILTTLSAFWFGRFTARVKHHFESIVENAAPAGLEAHGTVLAGRSMVCRKAEVVPIECVVRGYLAGSAWGEYRETGQVCGLKLPAGLRLAERLPEPIFTPATKAATGHDENVPFERAAELVDEATMRALRERSLLIYCEAAAYAEMRGIILADTKFEFGRARGGSGADDLILIDELLTPDSSRFWPVDAVEAGREPPSFDKQFLRNYLEGLCAAGQWDKRPPGPVLPPEVIAGTRRRYVEAYERLTGQPFR